MPVDLSWLDGSVEDAATMLADRAVASRALGGVVKAGERPAWADDLMKAAALLKRADPPVVPPAAPPAAPAPAPATAGSGTTGDFFDRNLGGLKKWVGEQAGAGIRDTMKQSPELQNAITGGIAGAGIGAIGGLGATMFSKNKRKRPVANALFGGMLGGLGGAAIGGLGGAGGLLGKQRQGSGKTLALDQQMAGASEDFKNRNEVTVMKTLRGLNAMNNSEIAKSFGTGAGIYGGAETGVRAAGRLRMFGGGTKQKLTADALRAAVSPSAATTATGWGVKGAPKPLKTDIDAVRRALQGSKLDVAKHLGTSGSNRQVVNAMRGRGWSMSTPNPNRMSLVTPGTLLRSGKAGLLGTLVGGASKGIDMENERVVPEYFKTMGTGLKARYGSLPPMKFTPGGSPDADLGVAVGPTDMTVQKRLDEITGRLTNQGAGKLTPQEVEALSGDLEAIKARMQLAEQKRIEAGRAAAGRPTGQ